MVLAIVSIKRDISANRKVRRVPRAINSSISFGSRTSDLLDLVHSDICEPMEVPSLGGCRYYLSFIDDKSRRITVSFLKQKSADEVDKAFEDFRCKAERQTGRKF